MHQSSYQRMAEFSELIKNRYAGREVRVLDVGSQGVNGTYKELFSFEGVEYVGLDVEAGPNVDVVPRDPYDWRELEDASFDVIVSGQALEHVEFPWLTLEQISRKLKAGGLVCLIAPSRGREHRYPVDCYRYLPDGMRALAKWCGLAVLETGLVEKTRRFKDGSEKWGDCHSILTKEGPLDDAARNRRSRPGGMRPVSGRPRHADNPLRAGKPRGYYQFQRRDVLEVIRARKICAQDVLELGCSSGATGEALKEMLGVKRYVGIELCEEAAELARVRLDEVRVADIDTTSAEELGLGAEEFDLLLALDVLEHLYDPWDVLADLVGCLRPGGHAVLSIPNVRNVRIIQGLGEGRWAYQGEGLLDATHVRFFTLEEIARLVEGAGLAKMDVTPIMNPTLDGQNVLDTGNAFTLGKLKFSNLSREELTGLFAYQYIVVCQKRP